MYKVINIQIKRNHPLYEYCVINSKLATNLFNAALFRQRQLFTSRNKETLSTNEQEVIDEINKTIKERNKDFPKSVMSKFFLIDLMTVNNNPDYYAGLPMQTAQHILEECYLCMKSFLKSSKDFKLHPEKYFGRPNLVNYKKKKSMSSFVITNQDGVIRKSDKGNYYCKFPRTKQMVNLGNKVTGKLKQIVVTPLYDIFQLSFIMEEDIQKGTRPINRIASIDLGVNNLMAVTNNCGLECLLFKAGCLKSVNQFYNKCLAQNMSAQTLLTKDKFIVDDKTNKVYLKRFNQVRDHLFKSSRLLINWCVENRIDTIIVGKNKFWKDKVETGKVNNQNFVQIPYNQLSRIIKCLCEQYGINFFEQEESYTSKASFLDNDFIPTYGVNDEKQTFSGSRVKRGLYKSKNGKKINADLNGSANILRKFTGECFNIDFNDIKVFSVKTGKSTPCKRG